MQVVHPLSVSTVDLTAIPDGFLCADKRGIPSCKLYETKAKLGRGHMQVNFLR